MTHAGTSATTTTTKRCGSTWLWRNPREWERLARVALPHVGTAPRCLSAGCSTGAEVYTLAAVMLEAGKRPTITGVDIDDDAIADARRGEFAGMVARQAPRDMLARHFTVRYPTIRANDTLRALVSFHVGDLFSIPLQTYDLVACRNVSIWHTRSDAQTLYHRITDSLTDGGFLFTGRHDFEPATVTGLVRVAPSIYRKGDAR